MELTMMPYIIAFVVQATLSTLLPRPSYSVIRIQQTQKQHQMILQKLSLSIGVRKGLLESFIILLSLSNDLHSGQQHFVH